MMNIRQLGKTIQHGYAKLPLHWLLACLVAFHGAVLLHDLQPTVYALLKSHADSNLNMDNLNTILDSPALNVLFVLVLGAGLIVNAIGLTLRARTAWVMSLFLLFSNLAYDLWQGTHGANLVNINAYLLLLITLLFLYGRHFNQASVISGTLFAVLGISLLLAYSTTGTLYLGSDFSPAINNISNAFYFSIVAMSTVGFGDIVPTSINSRLFTTSIIILGITVLATAVSAVIGPLIQGRIKNLVNGKHHKRMKKNHIILVGNSPLAQSVYTVLCQAQHPVVVIAPDDSATGYPADTDIIIGDASDAAVLTQANAEHATYVLALGNDDSENAFIVLAAQEAGGVDTKTVALVNSAVHVNKIKQVKPDVILSLPSLGAEILGRLIAGEPITEELISQLLFPLTKPSALNESSS